MIEKGNEELVLCFLFDFKHWVIIFINTTHYTLCTFFSYCYIARFLFEMFYTMDFVTTSIPIQSCTLANFRSAYRKNYFVASTKDFCLHCKKMVSSSYLVAKKVATSLAAAVQNLWMARLAACFPLLCLIYA